MFDRSAGVADFIGAHRAVADDHQLVAAVVFVEEVGGGNAFGVAQAVVLPHAFVDAVVEIIMFEMLELAAAGREQFLGLGDMGVHRPADVEEQQQLDRIVPFGAHADVEPALARGAVDGAVDVEFLNRAFAGEAAQPAQRDLEVAGAELAAAVEIAKFAFFPHFDRAAVAAFPADADAFGIIAAVAERRGAAGADPLAATLVAALLLGQTLLECGHDLVPRSQRLDLGHLLGGEVFFGDQPQPFLGDVGGNLLPTRRQHALEDFAEHLVKPVELALVVDEAGAGEVIELLGPVGGAALLDHPGVERLEQHQMLLERGRQPAAPQRLDKRDEHWRDLEPDRQRWKRFALMT